MTDEEFVWANWGRVEVHSAATMHYDEAIQHKGQWRLHFGGWDIFGGEKWYPSGAEAWSAAAEFTRERLEQIRQLEAEVEMVKNDVDNMRDVVIQRQYGSDWTVEYCRWTRVLARLDAALTDLKRGMKPTP